MTSTSPGKCLFVPKKQLNIIKSLKKLYDSEPFLEKLNILLPMVDTIDIKSFLSMQIKLTEKNYIRKSLFFQTKKDLEHQIEFIRKKFPKYTIIKDIGSGFNFERKGFISILEQVMHGNVEEIVVAHNDRLTRIGFNFILFICKNFNTKLTILSNKDDKEPKDEFTDEFISVITHYSAKFYGMRKYNLFEKN